MKVGDRGWLGQLIKGAVALHVPATIERPELLALPPRARARAHVRYALRERGLLYGTPSVTPGVVPKSGDEKAAPEERLFSAVVTAMASLGLEIADLVNAPKGPREGQLLVLFAALTDQFKEAEALDAALARKQPLPPRLVQKVESALEQRAMSLAGDPAYGLVLHNGAVYVDFRCFGRQATDYFVSGNLVGDRARRRMHLAAEQKAVLVEVLAALVCAEHPPSFAARRAILRQVEDLKLPDALTQTLRVRVRKFFERRPALAAVVRRVRSQETRRFILEQTLLASLVDGRRSPAEVKFVHELSEVLRFSQQEVKRVELDVAEFYRKNRSLVDVFTVSAGAEVMGEELVQSMQETLQKNFHRLMREVKETGELSVLLTKAARGKALSAEEKKRMRAQLVDVAKAIPALAIFAAPGGLLLLIALAKVLPFNLLPSAFQDNPDEDLTAAPVKKRV
jgi:hypothetical protein